MSKAKGNGKRLYQCDDCKDRRFVHWVELNRASRPRCNKCGSTRLEIVSDDAYDEMLNRQSRRIGGDGGSLVVSSDIKRKGRE